MMSFADLGWRVLSGVRPHVDFETALGPVAYLTWAAGLRLAGGSIDGIGYGDALISLLAGVWAYCVLVRRVGGVLAVAGGTMTTLLAVAPSVPGESFRLATLSMNYNRWGFAFLAVLIAEAFPLRSQAKPGTFAGGFSSGAICGILLFTKPSYFAVAVVLAAVSLVWSGSFDTRRLKGMMAGAAAVVFAFMAYLGFHAGALLADFRMAADARTGALSKAWVAQVFVENIPAFAILCGLAWMSQAADPMDAGSGRLARILRLRSLLLAAMVYCGGVMLLCTNCQVERLPLNEILVILFLDCILRGTPPPDLRYSGALAMVGLGLILGPVSTDALAVVNGVRLKERVPTKLAFRPDAGRFSSALFLDDYNQDSSGMRNHGAFVAGYLSDGVVLLRREMKPGELIATFDTFNPFPFALAVRPPRGGMAAAEYTSQFSDRVHLTPDAYFGEADLVMYPKMHDLPDAKFAGLVKYYFPALEARFTVVAESSWWKLYRRKA
jgi:hypothetical protein